MKGKIDDILDIIYYDYGLKGNIYIFVNYKFDKFDR